MMIKPMVKKELADIEWIEKHKGFLLDFEMQSIWLYEYFVLSIQLLFPPVL